MKNNITSEVQIDIEAPPEKLWEALTRPEIIKQYFFGTNAISDWRKGSSIVFKGEWEGKSYEDKGTILAIEPERKLQYDYWSSMSGIEDLPENYVIITYELAPHGDSTTLTITQENIPTEKMKEHSADNWRYVLHDLKALLEKDHVPA